MRTLSIALLAIVLTLFYACKEKGPYIIFGASAARDTTYLASVETPQNHNVLVEEFTGASCPNCPQGHATLNSIATANPGRINSIAWHINGFPQAQPVNGSKYDFRTDVAAYIADHIYPGVIAEPTAGIDRITYTSDGMLQYTNEWTPDAGTRLLIHNKINMYLTSNFNNTDTTASIQVKMAYTQADTGTENLTIAIVEDSLYDLQEDGINVDANYLFNNIFRVVVSAESGDVITPATREAGRVIVSNYNSFKVTKIVNPKHCRVIAFITKSSTSLEVIQSVQAPLAP